MARSIDRFKTTCLPGAFACVDAEPSVIQEFCCSHVIIAPKLPSGLGQPNTLIRVYTANDAAVVGGEGSAAHKMVDCWFDGFPNSNVNVILVDEQADDPTCTFASSTYKIASSATQNGSSALSIGGIDYYTTVALGDTQNAIANAISATINADPSRLVDATVSVDTLTFTSRHCGELGNGISVRLNPNAGDKSPFAVEFFDCLKGGAGNPDLCAAVDALGSCCYETVLSAYCNSEIRRCLDEEFDRRWSCEDINRGIYAFGKCGTFGDHLALLEEENNPHGLYGAFCKDSVFPVWQMMAGAMAGGMAKVCSGDPGPWRNIPIPCSECESGCDNSCFSDQERDTLICNGGSTFTCQDGCLVWEYAASMNTVNHKGQNDRFWRDIQQSFKVSFITAKAIEYSDRLAGTVQIVPNGTTLRVGTNTTTTALMKSEFFASIAQYEGVYYQNLDDFKRNSIFYQDIDSLVAGSNGSISVKQNGNPDGDPRAVNICLSYASSVNLQRINIVAKPSLQRVGA